MLVAFTMLTSDSKTLVKPWSNAQLEHAYGVSESTIKRMRRRFCQQGLPDAVHRRPQPERPEKRKINGDHQASLIATCCGPAPDGYAPWSVRFLADAFVVLEEDSVTQVSLGRETIRRTLRTLELKP